MKARLLIFAAAVALLLLITPAVSQVAESRWTANIPFDFVVADNQLPAGHYLIKCNVQIRRITVINTETQQKASMFTRDVQKLAAGEDTALIFQREEGRHVLHQIWGANESRGHDVVHGAEVIELTKMK